jgi:hypothetical protein
MACHAFLFHLAHSPPPSYHSSVAHCARGRSHVDESADLGFVQGVMLYGLGLTLVLVAGLQLSSLFRDRLTELTLRTAIRQQLQMAQVQGGVSIDNPSAGPFAYTLETSPHSYRLKAVGLPSRDFAGKTMVGCLQRSSGQMSLQEGFDQAEPPACAGLLASAP